MSGSRTEAILHCPPPTSSRKGAESQSRGKATVAAQRKEGAMTQAEQEASEAEKAQGDRFSPGASPANTLVLAQSGPS